MEIFKDAAAYEGLKTDLKHVYTCLQEVKTRMAEKTLDNLIERICEEMMLNLTDEAGLKLQKMFERHPDSDIAGMVDFLVFKTNVKLESAKDFVTRTGIEVDEDTVSQVRVYRDDFYIEVLDGGEYPDIHQLVIENQCWIEPETSLEEMELHLFNFATIVGGH